MPQDASQLVIAGTGKVLVAPVGTAAPVDAAAAFSATWVDLGLCSTDGVQVAKGRTIEKIMAWQVFGPVRRVVTEEDFRKVFQLIQWNDDIVKFAFGGGTVSQISAGQFKYAPPAAGSIDERALAVEIVDGSKVYRVITPKGIVTDEVASQFTKSQAAGLPITFGGIETTGVDPWYLLTNDPAFNPAA